MTDDKAMEIWCEAGRAYRDDADAQAAAAVIRKAIDDAVAERDAEVEAANQRAATAEHRLYSFRQHRAARSKTMAEFIKARAPELWSDYAALSVNGSLYSDELTMEPVYEREMNILRYRAERAEEELAATKAALGEHHD